MAYVQVQEDVVPVAGMAVVAHDILSVDWDQVDTDLAKAFMLQVSIRIERVQLWATEAIPLQNGNFTARSSVPKLPGMPGNITGLEALDIDGNVVAWDQAHSVVFTVEAPSMVPLPKSAIVAAVSGRFPLAGHLVTGLLTTLSSTIFFNIGHTAIHVPIVRDSYTNEITQIGSGFRPST